MTMASNRSPVLVFVVIVCVLLECITHHVRAHETKTWCPDGYRLGTRTLDNVCQLMSCVNIHHPNRTHVHIAATLPPDDVIETTDGPTITYCKAPTTSFVNCPNRMQLLSREYRVTTTTTDNDRGLGITVRNDHHVPLGEFVIVADGVALVCYTTASTLGAIALPDRRVLPTMCMPFTLPVTDCERLSNGSLRAVAINVVFRPGFFREHRDEYAVCHDLSNGFAQCPFKGRLPARYSYTLPDMSLYTNLSIVQVYELGAYAWTSNRTSSVVCVHALHTYPVNEVAKLLVEIAMIASVVCLFVTLLVHLLLPTSLKYHTKVLLCHTFSLLMMLVMTTVRFFGLLQNFTEVQCYAAFSVTYVATLGSFFWLSVLAFELWRAFSDLRPTVASTNSPGGRRRFLVQCAYAWGIPIGLCIVALSITMNKGLQDLLNLTFPMRRICWLAGSKVTLVFLYVPIVIILVQNTVFFVLTVLNLRKASQGTDILNKKISRQLLAVFAKLFAVMGLFWFADFLTWFFRKPDTEWPHPIDVVNALQGVAIFVVYVLKNKTLKLLKERLRITCCSDFTGRLRSKLSKTESTLSTTTTDMPLSNVSQTPA